MKQIPLHNRAGEVVAYAKVDDWRYRELSGYGWCLSAYGYAQATAGGETVYMHRLVIDAEPGVDVDHENRDKLDFQEHNLREASGSQNQCNRGPQSSNTSGFKGVCFDQRRQKYRA